MMKHRIISASILCLAAAVAESATVRFELVATNASGSGPIVVAPGESVPYEIRATATSDDPSAADNNGLAFLTVSIDTDLDVTQQAVVLSDTMTTVFPIAASSGTLQADDIVQIGGGQSQNWLVIGIQPRECIKLEIESKIPGLDINTRTIELDGANRQEGDETVDAYEALLLNLMEGDNSQYLHISEVEAQWRLVDPVIEAWAKDRAPVHQYPAGSSDPEASKIIFEAEDQFWRYSIALGGDKK